MSQMPPTGCRFLIPRLELSDGGDFLGVVTRKITETTKIICPAEPRVCLLGDVQRRKDYKMAYKFLQLALVLAKRRVTITWMGSEGPSFERWINDVMEWAVAELISLRPDDKLVQEIEHWSGMLEILIGEGEPEEEQENNIDVASGVVT